MKDRLLTKSDFIVLGRNRHDPSPHGDVEAWGYAGPLDFQEAIPLAFGTGNNPLEALTALSEKLTHLVDKPVIQNRRALQIAPPSEGTTEPNWRVVYTIDIDAPNAHTAAKIAHRLMTDQESLPPYLEVMDSQGRVISFDLSQTD